MTLVDTEDPVRFNGKSESGLRVAGVPAVTDGFSVALLVVQEPKDMGYFFAKSGFSMMASMMALANSAPIHVLDPCLGSFMP